MGKKTPKQNKPTLSWYQKTSHEYVLQNWKVNWEGKKTPWCHCLTLKQTHISYQMWMSGHPALETIEKNRTRKETQDETRKLEIANRNMEGDSHCIGNLRWRQEMTELHGKGEQKPTTLSGLVGTQAKDAKAIWKEEFNLWNSLLQDVARPKI